MPHPDYCIAGAGVIGLSLALELHRRGATVTVLERGLPLAEASYAAAGMLAANDPDNPAALQPLADLSISLYPDYLEHITGLSQLPVPFQTRITLQSHPKANGSAVAVAELLPQLDPGGHSFQRLEEHSVDPRQLTQSLLAAVLATTMDLRMHTLVESVQSTGSCVQVQTSAAILNCSYFIDCTGAWAKASSSGSTLAVAPRKGQMLSVALPASLALDLVVRTPEIYIVPRTQGPNAGRAVIGATIEERGFDKTIHPEDIARLQALAVALLPLLAFAPILETWAGLRPATADGLPLLGFSPSQDRVLLATGHYRNGILLAPATAHVMAQLLCGDTPSMDLSPYDPMRPSYDPARPVLAASTRS